MAQTHGGAKHGVDSRSPLPRAIGLHQKGRLDEAARIYRQVLKRSPGDPDALHFLGILLHQEGQSEAALDHLRRAIDACPAYADAHNNLGNVLKELGRLDEAIAAYGHALALRPDMIAAAINLGVTLRRRGRVDDALAVFERCLTVAPDSAAVHLEYGNTFSRKREFEAAKHAYRRALELDPQLGRSYNALWRALYLARDLEGAAAVVREWKRALPDDPAACHLAGAQEGGEVPDRASDPYVKRTFDEFAASYDSVLAKVDYRGPDMIAAALRKAGLAPAGSLAVLDAGCGTGLCGAVLRPFASRLVGVDLSPGMLKRASLRGVYDELIEGELTRCLEGGPDRFELIVATDTLNYFGRLEPVFIAAARALRPGGHLAFTVELAEAESAARGFCLAHHGRYAHDEEFVRMALASAGLALLGVERVVLRKEAGIDVPALVIVASRHDHAG